MPGFEEAGGFRGPGLDLYSKPSGDRRVARRYLRRAGYRSGRYTGKRRIVLVGGDDPIGRKVARVARRDLERLGFRVRLRLVEAQEFGPTCGDGPPRVHICAIGGWLRDFSDPQTILDPLFNGNNILEPATTTGRGSTCRRSIAASRRPAR